MRYLGAVFLLLVGCGGMQHFRVDGPASISIATPVGSVQVIVEEGGKFDSHPPGEHEPRPAAPGPGPGLPASSSSVDPSSSSRRVDP